MNGNKSTTPLSQLLPPLILGGAGFSHQCFRNPTSGQALEVIRRSFELGIRTIDTSAYYHPSEILLGEALSHSDITSRYSRDQYMLMTKAGRISANEFDYSPESIRKSVLRSLQRLKTNYLDVVFCHDVEFVPEEEAIQAVGVLIDMVNKGYIRYIGVSGYRIDILKRLAQRVQVRYGRPLDIVQNWAQLTLQNEHLASHLPDFKAAGVSCVCSSSPLAIGLLRDNGVPVGDLGDFHPAPPGLRQAAQSAARYVNSQGVSLAPLALRYALRRAQKESSPDFRVTTIMGVSSVPELEENLNTAREVLHVSQNDPHWNWAGEKALASQTNLNGSIRDDELCTEVLKILGPWHNYSFPSPGDGWDIANKRPLATLKL